MKRINTGFASTRRAFVGGMGLSIGATAMATAGTTALADEAAGQDWDEEYDVVVIGAGVAGRAAAATVALEGDGATCLLADKADDLGGNSPFSDGSVLYGHDVEGFYAYMKELCGEGATTPDDVIRAFAEGACELEDWIFGDLGGDESEARNSEPKTADDPDGNSAAEYPEYEHSWACGKIRVGKSKDVEVKGPTHVFELLGEFVDAHADVIEYRHGAAMTELVQDPETSRVTGAVIGGRRVHARRGVIMCCGGFESDPVMMQNYLGMGCAVPGAGIGNTGDGHRACMRVGADFWHMDHVAGFWMNGRDLGNSVSTNKPTGSGTKAFGITVGVNGRRYYMDFDSFHTSGDDDAYGTDLTLHVGSRHGHMQLGGDWPHAMQPRKAWFIFDQAGLEAGAIDPSYSSDPVADGLVYVADTIGELAEQAGVPVDELEATVQRWNECCDQGEDVYFHRPVSTLTPVRTAPFYAQLCAPEFLNTDGGPVRDAKGEILDVDGNPIPGLYSAGEFGSIWCEAYNGGGNLAEGLVFGRIAARSALAAE